MVRLIDADELRHSHCVECTLYPDKCLGKDCDWGSIYHIDHAPTVEAIPVEWLEDFRDGLDTLSESQLMRAIDLIIDAYRVEKKREEDLDYERASDMRDYCERYEPTYNPEDGSL